MQLQRVTPCGQHCLSEAFYIAFGPRDECRELFLMQGSQTFNKTVLGESTGWELAVWECAQVIIRFLLTGSFLIGTRRGVRQPFAKPFINRFTAGLVII